MANERFYQGLYWDNLGISYSSSTLTINGAMGRDLSGANPAYVILPSKSSPGIFKKYTITANQDFIDDSGASEITGNTFGYSTAFAISVDVPFFIYAVTNDDESSIAFMISRQPHRQLSPTAASIGAPDDAVADSEDAFFSFESLDETLYDSNPCTCIGSFRMQMSATWDWTVQTLATTDGIGRFQETTVFTQPVGQLGADASTIEVANGGTTPAFSTTTTQYGIQKDGWCWYVFFLNGDAGTDGAGAVTAAITTPFARNSSSVNIHGYGSGAWNGSNQRTLLFIFNSSSSLRFHIDNSANAAQWSEFVNGSRSITGTIFYKIGNV